MTIGFAFFDVCVLSLNWWNPIAWWASDDFTGPKKSAVTRWLFGLCPTARRIYGQTLLKAVEYLTSEERWPAMAGTPFGGCILQRRIEVILNHSMKHKISRLGVALVLVMSTVVLPVGMSRAFPEDKDAQILQAAQLGWAEYTKLFDRLQGTLTIESKLAVDGKRTFERVLFVTYRAVTADRQNCCRVLPIQMPPFCLYSSTDKRELRIQADPRYKDTPWQQQQMLFMTARRNLTGWACGCFKEHSTTCLP